MGLTGLAEASANLATEIECVPVVGVDALDEADQEVRDLAAMVVVEDALLLPALPHHEGRQPAPQPEPEEEQAQGQQVHRDGVVAIGVPEVGLAEARRPDPCPAGAVAD